VQYVSNALTGTLARIQVADVGLHQLDAIQHMLDVLALPIFEVIQNAHSRTMR
jgi:hypothetical protein